MITRLFRISPVRAFLWRLSARLYFLRLRRSILHPFPLLYTPPTIYGPDPITLARRQQVWSVHEANDHALSILRAKVDQLRADADRLRSQIAKEETDRIVDIGITHLTFPKIENVENVENASSLSANNGPLSPTRLSAIPDPRFPVTMVDLVGN